MWELKYNSGYSLFFEDISSSAYHRKPYSVYVDDKIVHKDLTTNTFSLYFEKNCDLKIKIISSSIEYCEDISLVDDNYFIDVCRYLWNKKSNSDLTNEIQALISSAPKNSTLYFRSGVYNIASLFLKSDMKIVFGKDVTFNITVDRSKFPIIPGLVEDKSFDKEFCISSWEGNPQECFSSIISGYSIENVELVGELTIQGNATDENWYKDVRNKVGSWRPKTLYFNNCEGISVHGLKIYNSPSWSVHPFYSKDIKFYDLYINNPKISPNTDGINPENCESIEINGCNFNLGDDCIAIKSGKIYMAKSKYMQTDKIDIRNCKMEHGHGAIVLGSEIACGLTNLTISNCFFNDTDRGLRVKTRRGRGEKSVIDNISFKNIEMVDVLAPITINAYYRCDPDGDSDYVASQKPIGEAHEIPHLGHFYFDNIHCKNIHQVICMAYGLPESCIDKIAITNSSFEFSQKPLAGHPLMMRDVTPIKDIPFNLLHVNCFELKNNTFKNTNKSNSEFRAVTEIVEVNNEHC